MAVPDVSAAVSAHATKPYSTQGGVLKGSLHTDNSTSVNSGARPPPTTAKDSSSWLQAQTPAAPSAGQVDGSSTGSMEVMSAHGRGHAVQPCRAPAPCNNPVNMQQLLPHVQHAMQDHTTPGPGASCSSSGGGGSGGGVGPERSGTRKTHLLPASGTPLAPEVAAAMRSEALERMLHAESAQLPLVPVLTLLGMFVAVLLTSMFSKLSPCGSAAYWLVQWAVVPALAVLWMVSRRRVLAKVALKKAAQMDFHGEVRWTPKKVCFLFFVFCCWGRDRWL